jgi:hypothetical protein
MPEEINPPEETSLEQAAAAGDTGAALLAVSTSATSEDAKRSVIYNCIVVTFNKQGLPTINDETARIVWTTFEDNVIIALGNGITKCINAKDYNCPALAPTFGMLKQQNQVTVVRDLVNGLAAVVKP